VKVEVLVRSKHVERETETETDVNSTHASYNANFLLFITLNYITSHNTPTPNTLFIQPNFKIRFIYTRIVM
jgi:hypothetical protein